MFPAWPASGPEPHASRPSAHSFSAPAGPNLPFTFSSRSGQPVNRQMLFAASVFQTRKHEVHIFSASKTIASGLAGQYLPLPILLQPPTRQLIPFRRQPADSLLSYFFTEPYASRPSAHSLPAPAGHYFPPPFFPYRPHNPQPANSFLPAWPANALHFFRPAAASPTRRPNAKRSFARGCSLQGCRWCGRGARVSFFSFFLFFSASLFSLSFPISLAPRLRRDAFIFLFAFVFLFVFFFLFFLLLFLLFSFCFFLFIFLLIFYSCFSLSFLFTFSFFLLLLLSLFSLFFFSLFFHFFTFAFFLFVFLFALFLSLLLSLFFVFLFALLFYPPHSNLFPHYPTARRPFVFSPPPPIFPIHSSHFPAAAKKKKISAKESTGVEWPPGSERAAGGKTEGRD